MTRLFKSERQFRYGYSGPLLNIYYIYQFQEDNKQ